MPFGHVLKILREIPTKKFPHFLVLNENGTSVPQGTITFAYLEHISEVYFEN